MISKAFIKNSFIYTVAGMLPMASAVILLPFYLHYLSLERYGELAFYLAFSMLVQVGATFSFDSSLYIYYHDYKNDRSKLAELISSAYVFMAFLGIAILLFFVVAGSFIFGLVSRDTNIAFFPYGLLSVFTAIFQAFFKVHNSLLQTREKPETFFWANLISFSLIAVFTVAGLKLYPQELTGPIAGRALAALISGSWAIIRIFTAFGFHFNFPFLRSTFRINNSTFIYQLQQWFINYFDRVLITIYLTMEDVGSYDFVWKCLLVIDFITGGLYNSFYPKVIASLAEQETKRTTSPINRYYHGLTAAIMILVGSAIFLFPLLSHLGLMKPDYREALKYIPFMALIYLVRGMRYYFGLPYAVLKYTKPLPVIYLIISAVKIGVMLLFIRKYGIMAVIGATLFSNLLEVVFLRFTIREKFQFHFNAFKIIVAPLLLGALIVVLETAVADAASTMLHAAYLVFAIVILLWLYRRELKLITIDKFRNGS